MSLPKMGSVLLVGATLLGCSDAASVVAPTRMSASDVALAADRVSTGDDVSKQSVQGEALFEPTDQGVSDVHYSVEAKRHKNGSIDGEFRMRLTRNGNPERFSGEVSCFGIVANTAHVSVRVERSTNPDVKTGDYLIFTVQDNDQPEKSKGKHPLDKTSFFFLGDESLANLHCTLGLNVAMYPVVDGQFELHPEPDTKGGR